MVAMVLAVTVVKLMVGILAVAGGMVLFALAGKYFTIAISRVGSWCMPPTYGVVSYEKALEHNKALGFTPYAHPNVDTKPKKAVREAEIARYYVVDRIRGLLGKSIDEGIFADLETVGLEGVCDLAYTVSTVDNNGLYRVLKMRREAKGSSSFNAAG